MDEQDTITTRKHQIANATVRGVQWTRGMTHEVQYISHYLMVKKIALGFLLLATVLLLVQLIQSVHHPSFVPEIPCPPQPDVTHPQPHPNQLLITALRMYNG